MLLYRTTAQKVLWKFDSVIMQNLSDILPLFCTPTCPPHHVSATQELSVCRNYYTYQQVTMKNGAQ